MRDEEHRRRLFADCVQSQAASLYRVAYRLTGCHASANDLVQETFSQAWQGLSRLNDESRMRQWMFSILRRQYGKSARRIVRERVSTEISVDDLAQLDSSHNSLDTVDLQAQLQSALHGLEDRFKLPLLLVSMEGLSVDEAAEVLGIPRGTVLSRLHRARERLKSAMVAASDKTARRARSDVDSLHRSTATP